MATEFYSYLNAAESSGRITSSQNEYYKSLSGQAIRNQKANDLVTSLDFETNTLSDTYGSKIQESSQKVQKAAGEAVAAAQQELANGMMGRWLLTMEDDVKALSGGNGKSGVGLAKWISDADQSALNDLWEVMKPDANAMRSLVDEYVNVGQDVPKQIMDKFNETMALGAASGDASAAWDVYAKNIADSGDKALIDAVNKMDADGQLGEEFSAAWKRATASVTDEPVELGDLKAEVDGVDIDKDAWVSRLNEKLGDLATTEEVTAEGATIKVEAGDCLWDIGNALGVDWQTIAEENGIESPYIIHPGDEIRISMDTLTAEVDGDAAQEAINQAMSALTTEGAEFSVTAEGVQVDLADVQVDSESVAAQIETALGMESGTLAANKIDVQTGATVTVPAELVQVDASGLQEATQEAISQTETEPVEKDTSANVNVTDTTTNTGDVQGKVEEDLQGAVGEVPVEGSADVTISDATTDTAGVEDSVTSELEGAVSNVAAAGHAEITLDQSNNADEIYSLATDDVVTAFAQTIPSNGHANITLDQTNNADEIYAQATSEVQSIFSTTIPASASVAVTLDWHITNPSASISTSNKGSSVSATIAGHAFGGEVGTNGPELSWVGEEGLEYIIPTVPARRQRGIELWESAGRTLGVLGPDGQITAHANGGAVGGNIPNAVFYSNKGSSVSATIAGHAFGGEVGTNGPELSWVGEEGLEYIIPTVLGRRQKGIDLWMQAGKTLGMFDSDDEISAHASGGAVGAGSSLIPEDSMQLEQMPEKKDAVVWSVMGQAISSESSKGASEGDEVTSTVNNTQQNSSGEKVEINVNMNPVIKIEGNNMDKEEIFQVLQERMSEMVDDFGNEIAERMTKIFNNMPAVQEA